MSTETQSDPASDHASVAEVLLSRRFLFLVLAIILLFLTTGRFEGDLWAFFYSLIILTVVMALDS